MSFRITSASNDTVKHVKRLMADRACRYENRQFAAEGRKLYADAVQSALTPAMTFLCEETPDEEMASYEALGGAVYLLPRSLFERLCDTKSPQGVLGVFELPHPTPRPVQPGDKLLLLCSLQDPGNVGAILRTAEAFGIAQVLLSADCPDLYSPKVLRASMGGVFRLPCAVVEDAEQAIASLRGEQVRVWATALRRDAIPLGEADLSGAVCTVIGNEGSGLPDRVIQCCDASLMIPMPGRAQSLNAAAAAAIVIWEMAKQL